MGVLAEYLSEMTRIRASGEASDETSYYPVLAELINAVGGNVSPSVHCVLTPKNRGSGIPDGALFLKRSLKLSDSNRISIEVRSPERGVMEIKPASTNLNRLARSKQVAKYLDHYGQVLITNYREFRHLRLNEQGEVIEGEGFAITNSESTFWSLAESGADDSKGEELEQFLRRVLLADAPLSSPEDLASFLAAYAQIARTRIEEAGELKGLAALKSAFEDALGLRFEADAGEEFFRSALVQTLFYGVFASWVNWSAEQSPESSARFSWQKANWTLNVPMVRVLFDLLVTPRNLPAGLDQILDWTEDVFARVDRRTFFEKFERREAVRYFYEPFLQAYDPRLRRELGVWFTPPEVVRYMVARVHESLQRDMDIPLGLADERVHVLDPCTGTGSFLIEALKKTVEVLEDEYGDGLAGQEVKEAALKRFHGFEVLPAPFIITHLQLGLFLDELRAPLDSRAEERPSVYLTNALTGWRDAEESFLDIVEFQSEREAAGNVKRSEPILVVLGNPPYNGFAGIREQSDDDLIAPYKAGLSEPPWEVTKNKLDDYYVRFFRVAERRIAEQTGRGIICFISNFGWLGDPSTVLMRQHLMRAFDHAYVDNLNGDSRETGKKTPDGKPDPSVFSSEASPSGIQVGTAITLLVRTEDHKVSEFQAMYRDFWGSTKLADLGASLDKNQEGPPYEQLSPNEKNWYRLRRWNPRLGYEAWPKLIELAAARADLGLNENRGEALIDLDRDVLERRMRHFLDDKRNVEQIDPEIADGLLEPWSGYDAAATRKRMLKDSAFDTERLKLFQTKPFDVRWAYIDPTPKLWNRPRPQFLEAAKVGSDFLLFRKRSPRALDGAAFMLSQHLVDQHVLHKDAYAVPLLLAEEPKDDDAADRLFPVEETAQSGLPWRPNLSQLAHNYLAELGYDDADTSRGSARLIWLHALAIGYSPLYLEENGDAIRNDWPRVPLPITRDHLEDSANLGVRIAGLLDIDTPLPGLDTSASVRLQSIASIEHKGGGSLRAADLDLTVGWGHAQIRKQNKSGAISRIVMPGAGMIVRRPRTSEEHATLSASQLELLGDTVLDVYLNDKTYWRGVPETVWSFKVGGFQVLRKWLSYRENVILGRPLTFVEARQFRSIARRLTELVLMAPALDANYRAATGSVDQDPLPELTPLELHVS